MRHYWFSKAAFDLLSARLTACNRVFNALDDAEQNIKDRIYGGVSLQSVLKPLDVVRVIQAISDHNVKHWVREGKIASKAPTRLQNGSIDGQPLILPFSSYQKWLDSKGISAGDSKDRHFRDRTIQRAFLHFFDPRHNWSSGLPAQVSGKKIGVSDRFGYASLLAYLIWDCSIEVALKLPQAGEYILEFDKADCEEDKLVGSEDKNLDKDSMNTEGQPRNDTRQSYLENEPSTVNFRSGNPTHHLPSRVYWLTAAVIVSVMAIGLLIGWFSKPTNQNQMNGISVYGGSPNFSQTQIDKQFVHSEWKMEPPRIAERPKEEPCSEPSQESFKKPSRKKSKAASEEPSPIAERKTAPPVDRSIPSNLVDRWASDMLQVTFGSHEGF